VYPDEAKRAQVQGVVPMEVRIDEKGNVSDTPILRSIPLLDQAATDAVKQWKYATTIVNGAAVPVSITVMVNFTLREQIRLQLTLPALNLRRRWTSSSWRCRPPARRRGRALANDSVVWNTNVSLNPWGPRGPALSMLMRMTPALVFAFGLSCATTAPPVVKPRISPEQLASRLAEADRLAAHGCYLCLKEAAAAYAALVDLSDDPSVARKALENTLMMVLREIELRLPDSGAREAAVQLQSRVTEDYTPYIKALDSLAVPLVIGGIPSAEIRQRREDRVKLATELEKKWPASPMKAYFYLATALNAGMVAELKPQLDAILSTHSQDLSLKYRMQAFLPTFSVAASRALIGQETGFGEVHFLLGQRAVLDASLGNAHRELTRARELLPDSAAISLVLANVTLAYARYADALTLFERVLAAGPDEPAQLGRAKALSYLGRHTDAIAALDELLQDLQNNPGEKYYWRSWNYLRLAQVQAAYDDALAALNAMRNNEVYRLAGIASYSLNRLPESRDYFENALKMNGGDCDAQRYLGLIDSADRSWKAAFARFTNAVGCYDQALARMAAELADHEKDISGLSNALIAGARAEIKEAEALRAASATNATIASKNAGDRP
jgi:TonB family protein